MTRHTRAVVLVAAVALAFLAAANVGAAKPDARQFQNLPPCAAGQQPTYQNPCMPAGGIPQGGGQQPSQGGVPQGGVPQGGVPQGGMPQGGTMMRPDMPACAAGVMPTRDAPCMIDMDMKECGPEGPPQLNADGSLPAGAVPCRPAGAVQFDQAPPTEATNKLMTLDVEVDGSGEKPGTFDVTLVRIVKGIGKAARQQMEEQLEGESFVIYTNASSKCFADKKSDPDAIADKVPCKLLSDEVDDSAVVIKATVQARMKFDKTTFTPTFTATKIVIKGKSKI